VVNANVRKKEDAKSFSIQSWKSTKLHTRKYEIKLGKLLLK